MGFFTNVLFRKWPMNHRKLRDIPPLYRCAACIGLILILCCIPSSLAAEAGRGQVEEFTGYLSPGDIIYYTIPGLQRGDTVSAYADGLSGNLDPFLALSNTVLPPNRLKAEYLAAVDREIAAGRDPLVAIPETAARFFNAWDDDSGPGYSSALSYQVQRSGDYQMILLDTPVRETSGAYRLLIGVNAPGVPDGTAVPTGDDIAYLNRSLTGNGTSVQEVSLNLLPGKESGFRWLSPVLKGDTLYVFLDAGPGDVPSRLVLEDYGRKPVAIGVPAPGSRVITLSHIFPESGEGYRLVLYRSSARDSTESFTYRLLAGINEPAVLSGDAEPQGRAVFEEPITVYIGTQIDQITGVNQKDENYGVVATIWMTWNDPYVAFSPDTCNCSFKLYRSIADFAGAEGSRFPEFTLFNQQERRWTQNELTLVEPNGTVTYIERFWVTLQAPDFDFRRYPFDTQDFYLRIDSLYPETYVVYAPWEEKTAIGSQLGEEEWVITSSDTNISTIDVLDSSSRYSFHFVANRHLNYYIFRIFVPITIIIILTYIPFLLADYGKRADIAAANLLLLLLFSFTVTSDLPRLGYSTFLDIILVLTFIISGFTVAYNLYLKWLATEKGIQLAERIDHIMLWFYPAAYIVAIVGLMIYL
jgi:hypothetical protein